MVTIIVSVVVSIPIGTTIAIIRASPAPAPTWSPGIPWVIKERVIISAAIRIIAAIIRPTVTISCRPAVRIAYANINIGTTAAIASCIIIVIITEV
jgi:hypothetical protein